MGIPNDSLEAVWAELLSGDPARIRRAWGQLTDQECATMLDHLRQMVEEPGWQPAQKDSAALARREIREQAE